MKQNTSIHTLRRCPCYTLDILTISLWYGGTKADLNDIQKRTKWKTQNYQTGLSNFTKKNCVFWRTDIKDENNIQTTLYRKPSDQQAFLYVISEHLRSLNSSIPCTEFGKQSVIIKQKFLHGQYEEELLDEQIKKRR